MPAFHTMKFHDVTHTLESVGYRLIPDGNGFVVDEPDPQKLVDTLRLTQRFTLITVGLFFSLIFSDGQRVWIDADQFGTRIHEPEHN